MYNRRADNENVYDLFARGMRVLVGGHPLQAAIVLARAKSTEPEKASIREALRRALHMSDWAKRARRGSTKTVQIDPADDYAHFALALVCERTGQRERAIGHLKKAGAMRPGKDDCERALRRLDG